MLGVKTARPGAIAGVRFRFPTLLTPWAPARHECLAPNFIFTISHIHEACKRHAPPGTDLKVAA